MTVYAIAIIDSNTEVNTIYVPGAVFHEEGTYEENSSKTIVHIRSEVSDMMGFQQTQYYKGGAWKSREWKGEYYNWNGTSEEWEFDSNKFWETVRTVRNSKLGMCDWTQLPDSPLSDSKKAEWAEYRTILRRLPAMNSSATNLDEIVWPDEPS